MNQKKRAWIVFLTAFLFIALFTQHSIDSGNDASRIASIESLVERGTWVVDDSSFDVLNHAKFNDKIHYNGHFYSSKPPVLSFIATPPYFLFYHLGIEFEGMGKTNLAYYLEVLFTIGLFYALLITIFYLFLVKSKLKSSYTLLLTVGLGAGTLIFTYGTIFNNHLPSTSFLFTSFFITYFINEFKHKLMMKGLAGLLAGFAITFEPPAIIIASFLALLLSKDKEQSFKMGAALFVLWMVVLLTGKNPFFIIPVFIGICVLFWKYLWQFTKENYPFMLAFMLPLLLYATLNMAIIESPLPQHLHPDHREFYRYPGAPWPEGDPTGDIPNAEFIIHSTLGYRGLFSYSPILLLGLAGMWYAWKRKETKLVSFLIGVGAFTLYTYYVVTNHNYGGYSYGIRRLIILTPFLLLFAKELLPIKQQWLRYGFYTLLGISILFALIGVYEPWADIWGYDVFFNQPIPLLNNLKNFLQEYILTG